MIGTSDDKQKGNWNSYETPLVHAYNVTKHEYIGNITFCWMFSRQPRLSIDAYTCSCLTTHANFTALFLNLAIRTFTWVCVQVARGAHDISFSISMNIAD